MRTKTLLICIAFALLTSFKTHSLVAQPNPIFIAAADGEVDNIKKLVTNQNINLKDSNGQTPLHHAVANLSSDKVKEKNYLEVIRYLKEKGADINAKNNSGDTPLSIAQYRVSNTDFAAYNYKKVLEILDSK